MAEECEIVRCRDCDHYFKDHDDCVVTYRCELNHERMRDDFFCADGIPRAEVKQAVKTTGIAIFSNSVVMILHADPEKIIEALKKLEEKTDADD